MSLDSHRATDILGIAECLVHQPRPEFAGRKPEEHGHAAKDHRSAAGPRITLTQPDHGAGKTGRLCWMAARLETRSRSRAIQIQGSPTIPLNYAPTRCLAFGVISTRCTLLQIRGHPALESC